MPPHLPPHCENPAFLGGGILSRKWIHGDVLFATFRIDLLGVLRFLCWPFAVFRAHTLRAKLKEETEEKRYREELSKRQNVKQVRNGVHMRACALV